MLARLLSPLNQPYALIFSPILVCASGGFFFFLFKIILDVLKQKMRMRTADVQWSLPSREDGSRPQNMVHSLLCFCVSLPIGPSVRSAANAWRFVVVFSVMSGTPFRQLHALSRPLSNPASLQGSPTNRLFAVSECRYWRHQGGVFKGCQREVLAHSTTYGTHSLFRRSGKKNSRAGLSCRLS